MAESFLYHGSLLMLFDHSFDPLHNVQGVFDLESYFKALDEAMEDDLDRLPGPTFQPVLGVSFKFFLLVAEITRYSRSPFTSSDPSTDWIALDSKLRLWESTAEATDGSDGVNLLYVIATRALLTKSAEHLGEEQAEQRLSICMESALKVLRNLTIDIVFSHLFLWPIAILGSLAKDDGERSIFEAMTQGMASRRKSGLISWGRYRLQWIWKWTDQRAHERRFLTCKRLEGLRMLVEEESLDCTNAGVSRVPLPAPDATSPML